MPALLSRPLAATGAALLLAAAGCGEPAPVAVRGSTLRLTLSEYRIAPQNVHVTAGRITLVVRNAGTIVHQLQLRRRGGMRPLLSSPPLRPGQSTTITVVLGRGDYRDACPLERHDTLGEHGTIRAR